MSPLLSGLALGVAGSAHCAAMCGPLVLVAQAAGSPERHPRAAWQACRRMLSYHAGRTVTYMLLGMCAGIAGEGLAAGLGSSVAVIAGVLLVWHGTGLSAKFDRLPWRRATSAAGTWIARTIPRRGLHLSVVRGAVHGLLPCGTLYLALVAAVGLGEVRDAVIFMAGFAVGTMPVLAVIALSGRVISARLPAAASRVAPAVVVLVGLLLVARGFDLTPLVHGIVHERPAANVVHAEHPH